MVDWIAPAMLRSKSSSSEFISIRPPPIFLGYTVNEATHVRGEKKMDSMSMFPPFQQSGSGRQVSCGIFRWIRFDSSNRIRYVSEQVTVLRIAVHRLSAVVPLAQSATVHSVVMIRTLSSLWIASIKYSSGKQLSLRNNSSTWFLQIHFHFGRLLIDGPLKRSAGIPCAFRTKRVFLHWMLPRQ
ncbi:expressed unknown protein [Seminavis robusta]|uniref:Uncharacterized protein n=1 Tax=Seminavis robusta TaxID=568900 RepID=A0A9N8HP21_9STRA|nr:expressed unknown protein [Seminavis robusta]|eukprot:Sro1031_g233401.1  (184) ;mRNA; r:7936-8487